MKAKKIKKFFMETAPVPLCGGHRVRICFALFIVFSLVLISQCESTDRFYRPNLPEKLCSIGIIDADDTIKNISFEKSFQKEYLEEVNDSLREFSFKISSTESEIYSYRNNQTIKDLLGFELPHDLKFQTGSKYFLYATEKDTPPISAVVTIAEAPEKPILISLDQEIIPLLQPLACSGLRNSFISVINFSFENNPQKKSYYALLLKGTGYSLSSSNPFISSNLMDFAVRECNSPGFFAVMHGLKMNKYICNGINLSLIKSPVNAYFIEGSKIPSGKCTIKVSAKFSDDISLFVMIKSLQIKVLSIPEELYLFEKSLYTYAKISEDPFSEPIYLNGNIIGGNGVFAICRSSELTVNPSFTF